MVGSVFYNYTVIDINSKRPYHWVCKCLCGVIKDVRYSHLKLGHVKSCGCHKDAIATKHGYTRGATKGKRMVEYNVWAAMLRRCKNPSEKKYNIYGGRGIKVCERWHKFVNFLSDMGRRPIGKYSIDRFPNKDGDYEPNNCRWATIEEQNRNLRSNRYFEHEGKRMVLKDWANELNVCSKTISTRLRKGQSFCNIYNHFKL